MSISELINTISLGYSPEVLQGLPDECIDLTVTSPPYDKLRKYANNEASFDFPGVAAELYRITKVGGVVVWVVNDQITNGSETLTSFKQAIHFREQCGFLVYDTMIFAKRNPPPLNHRRYEQQFEYMFVFSKGKPKTFNPIRVPLLSPRTPRQDKHHMRNYSRKNGMRGHNTDKIAGNIWSYSIGKHCGSKDSEAWQHPASFPEDLARDQILSWSNPGDVVFDPFCGSGTTCKLAKLTGRSYIGFDASPEYVALATARVAKYPPGSASSEQSQDYGITSSQ